MEPLTYRLTSPPASAPPDGAAAQAVDWDGFEAFVRGERAAKPDRSERTSITLRDAGETPKPPTKALRRKLYQLADAYRPHTRRPRVAKCAHTRASGMVGVEQRQADRSASFAGLVKCRCKVCPPCLARRRSQYAEEILRVTDLWAEANGHSGVYLATFTIRHGMGDSLETTGLGVRAAWRSFVSSSAWQSMRREWGLEYIVAEEVTFGGHGWHPHLHVLFLARRWLREPEYVALADQLHERWARVVCRVLGERYVPSAEHGTDFRPARKEDYIAKAVGLELADPGTKQGKRKKGEFRRPAGRTPIQLLASYDEHNDELALERYQEYERVMSGRRDLTWSRGLKSYRQRAKAELKEEASEERKERLLLLAMPGVVWDKWRHVRRSRTLILEAAERGGAVEVHQLLRRELGQWAVDATLAATAECAASEVSLHDLAHLAHAREPRAPP